LGAIDISARFWSIKYLTKIIRLSPNKRNETCRNRLILTVDQKWSIHFGKSQKDFAMNEKSTAAANRQ